ncbi:MAG: gluconate kinase [Pseudopedobacter saltans]|uniref:Gluconokinase n=1 Tax=Pseudopedobacter saltans TaxID=151895 RepID=A0A2W5F867_9SPHI|nr:MAG: gluconate kinase [Pseudopedobacter saltans]
MNRKCIIVMGVSSSGKSTIGSALAEHFNYVFIDGDHLQPKSNIEKIKQKIPLTDEDRAQWMSKICTIVMEQNAKGEDCVVACGAIKRKYRSILRGCIDNAKFIYLKANVEMLIERNQNRKNHWMSTELLEKQFAALEEPDNSEKDILTVPINQDIAETVANATKALKQHIILS